MQFRFPSTSGSIRTLAGSVLAGLIITASLLPSSFSTEISSDHPLRILPLGDSITRGSYIARYEEGPFKGQATSLPNPLGGGWRKLLQDRLRARGVRYDFVGELSYQSYGRDGTLDPEFDPDHHGLAGFGSDQIITGGTVPTLPDALAALGVEKVIVPDIVTVLAKHRPDVILLMTGANGLDERARDKLIRLIGENTPAHLFVATILPQRPPRANWEKVEAFNASLPSIVADQRAAGHRITLVDMHHAVKTDNLLPDGVHPNAEGMQVIADTWFRALQAEGLAP